LGDLFEDGRDAVHTKATTRAVISSGKIKNRENCRGHRSECLLQNPIGHGNIDSFVSASAFEDCEPAMMELLCGGARLGDRGRGARTARHGSKLQGWPYWGRFRIARAGGTYIV
jgi:hypothetical protein